MVRKLENLYSIYGSVVAEEVLKSGTLTEGPLCA